jgi:hypothetical protein
LAFDPSRSLFLSFSLSPFPLGYNGSNDIGMVGFGQMAVRWLHICVQMFVNLVNQCDNKDVC